VSSGLQPSVGGCQPFTLHLVTALFLRCCVQAFERVWKHLAAAAGLPASSVLDLRGNHDAFDTMRGLDKVGGEGCVWGWGVWGGG
jgi:hypothetical protein